jgi:hypothetical protein
VRFLLIEAEEHLPELAGLRHVVEGIGASVAENTGR